MEQTLINDVVQGMLPHLTNGQLEELRRVLTIALQGKTIVATEKTESIDTATENNHLTELFIAAKRIEGCSEKSLKYYTTTIETMLLHIGKPIKHITTDDLRGYLTDYQSKRNSSKSGAKSSAISITKRNLPLNSKTTTAH